MENREGKILRERREELGMTQEQVAFDLHMSTHQYQRFEYGKTSFSNCRMRTGLRICAVLELDPYEVVFEK